MRQQQFSSRVSESERVLYVPWLPYQYRDPNYSKQETFNLLFAFTALAESCHGTSSLAGIIRKLPWKNCISLDFFHSHLRCNEKLTISAHHDHTL